MLYRNTETGAFGLSENAVRDVLSHLSLPETLAGADLLEFGFEAYTATPPPETAWGEMAVEAAPVGGAQQWSVVSNGLTLLSYKNHRLGQLADRRKVAVRAFTFGPMTIDLDKDTEDAIAKCRQGLLDQLDAGVEEPSIDFEYTRGEFITMDLPTIIGMGRAAFAHVQACFTNVRALTALIKLAEDAEEVDMVDIEVGWPS